MTVAAKTNRPRLPARREGNNTAEAASTGTHCSVSVPAQGGRAWHIYCCNLQLGKRGLNLLLWLLFTGNTKSCVNLAFDSCRRKLTGWANTQLRVKTTVTNVNVSPFTPLLSVCWSLSDIHFLAVRCTQCAQHTACLFWYVIYTWCFTQSTERAVMCTSQHVQPLLSPLTLVPYRPLSTGWCTKRRDSAVTGNCNSRAITSMAHLHDSSHVM